MYTAHVHVFFLLCWCGHVLFAFLQIMLHTQNQYYAVPQHGMQYTAYEWLQISHYYGMYYFLCYLLSPTSCLSVYAQGRALSTCGGVICSETPWDACIHTHTSIHPPPHSSQTADTSVLFTTVSNPLASAMNQWHHHYMYMPSSIINCVCTHNLQESKQLMTTSAKQRKVPST